VDINRVNQSVSQSNSQTVSQHEYRGNKHKREANNQENQKKQTNN
jgi:hypothetical protein